jgi:hypothetical protein
VLELILSFNPTSATIAQPLKKSYYEKVKHFVIFDEIGHLAAGMTHIHVQLPLNITAIYHRSEIMEANLRKIVHTNSNYYIRQAFGNANKLLQNFFKRILMELFWGTFTAHEILQLCRTMNQFVHTQNLLAHVTARNQNKIRAK